MPTETPHDKSALHAAHARLLELIERFAQYADSKYLKPDYQEAEARKDFIDPMFKALGWDVDHERETNPYEQEVKVELGVEVARSQKRADYAFYLAPRFNEVRFFVEAKKPSVALDKNVDAHYQILRYGYSAKTPLAVLTDFEEIHVIDCRARPHPEKLGDLIDDDGMQRGVSPDLKEAFIVNRETASKWKLEDDHLRCVLTGGRQVKRYYIDRQDLLLIYTTRDTNTKALPNIRAYIDQFAKQITCKEVKDHKHSIYALHRARDETIFTKATKYFGVVTEDEIVIAPDDSKTFATDGLYLFGMKPEVSGSYVMGVLNSRLFVFLYRLLAFESGRVLAQVKPTLLVQLPIRKIDFANPQEKSRHDGIVALVEQMLEAKKQEAAASGQAKEIAARKCAALDRQIDALVYELYDLTPEEIALVEGHG